MRSSTPPGRGRVNTTAAVAWSREAPLGALAAGSAIYAAWALMPASLRRVLADVKDKVKEVQVVAPNRVRFVLREAWPDFMAFYGTLATAAGWIVPKKYVEKVGDEGFKKAPVGAGPYKFVERVAQGKIVVERFADYWDKGRQEAAIRAAAWARSPPWSSVCSSGSPSACTAASTPPGGWSRRSANAGRCANWRGNRSRRERAVTIADEQARKETLAAARDEPAAAVGETESNAADRLGREGRERRVERAELDRERDLGRSPNAANSVNVNVFYCSAGDFGSSWYLVDV